MVNNPFGQSIRNIKNFKPFMNPLTSQFMSSRSSSLSESEEFLLADTQFRASFNKNIVGKSTSRRDISKSSSVKRVSAANFEKLLDIDLFRDSSDNILKDIANTGMTTSKFSKNFKTGEVRRTGGQELSTLDEAGLEQLAQVVSGRQAQIQGRALGTGLGQQSFSLLSGNFG